MNSPDSEPSGAQPSLFDIDAPLGGLVAAATPTPALRALAAQMNAGWGRHVRLGTSSWHSPGWAGLVWARSYSETLVSREGLTAYAQHPLLRTVSLDRSFYRAVDTATYARMAAQVPADFRFMVKVVSSVTDATLRDSGSGRALHGNPLFLDPATALDAALRPAVAGLGDKLAVLVFQLSPLPRRWLDDLEGLHQRLDSLLGAVAQELPAGVLCAVEVRDPDLLTPDFVRLLSRHGARYCLGLHDRMPPIADQLPMLRAQWPGPLVCRWNLQRGLGYEHAKTLFKPFDKLAAPDPETRYALARVIAATAKAGHPVFVTINNKAEGSAPLSIIELVRALFAPAPGSAV